ncbi:RIIB lysis inhibitor [Escherichia phage 4MG]|uniref:RIIB protein n=1 Tax=Escherichia phage 4MG TaxID=1391428 RepID=V5KSH7_9CAUD|nr:RIIB lysis inhibitor [Escherichia phage 4MG]AGZ17476.1 rIIB protein [Escherichia phage 4MG]
MSQLFVSRSAARKFAAENGMKVVDRGVSPAVLATGRWMVVPKDSQGASKPPEVDMSFTSEAVPAQSSMFFASRGEARDFARGKKNAKIIDHAQGPRGVNYGAVKDLGKQGKRWEVTFEVTDLHIEATVTLLPEPRKVPVTVVVEESEPKTYFDEETVEKKDPVVIMTPGNVCISMPDGTQHTINRDNEIFPDVGLLLIEGDIDGAIALIEAGKEAKAEKVVDLGPDLKLLDGILYWHGQKQETTLAKRILNDIENGTFDERYVKFMQKLMHNPSYASVQMLYDFIQHNDLEILENGDVKAYKKITNTGDGPRDTRTKKVPNYKGQIISMPRNMVEDNPSVSCSQGLHIASLEYAGGFGGNSLIEVAVNPADVVSVPYDYNQQKCRCCRYEVLTGVDKPVGAPDILVIGAAGEILEQIYLEEETKED